MKEIRKKLEKETCYTQDRTVLIVKFDEDDNIDVRKWFKEIGKVILEKEYPKNYVFFIYSYRIAIIQGSKWFPNTPNSYNIL